MKITRLEGITSNILLCNSLQVVKATGSNQSVGTYASASVNDVQIPSITSASGLYVIVFDEYLNRLETRRFSLLPTSPSGTKDIDFINFVGTLPPRRYYLMVSNGVISHTTLLDDFFTGFMGCSIWSTMWDTYQSIYGNTMTAPLSFVCFGNTDLGVTHQSYALTEEASLVSNLSDYDKFAITGYGTPLYEINNQQFNSTFSNYLISDLDGAKALCCSFRYNNAVNNNDIFIRKIYDNSTTSDVVIPTVAGQLNKTSQYHINLEANVTAVRVYCRNVFVYYSSIAKANSGTIVNPVSAISKKGKGFSVKDVRFGLNGYDFESTQHLSNFSMASNVAPLPTAKIIDGVSMRSFTNNGTFVSDYIEVEHTSDYYFGMFVQRTVNTNSPTYVRIRGYDADYNPVQMVSATSQTSLTTLQLGNFNLDTNDVVYQEYYVLSSKQMVNDLQNATYLFNGVYGEVSSGGLSANVNNITDVGIMTSSVKYIKIELSSSISNQYISPNFNKIRFSLTKDSRYIGNITEN